MTDGDPQKMTMTGDLEDLLENLAGVMMDGDPIGLIKQERDPSHQPVAGHLGAAMTIGKVPRRHLAVQVVTALGVRAGLEYQERLPSHRMAGV